MKGFQSAWTKGLQLLALWIKGLWLLALFLLLVLAACVQSAVTLLFWAPFVITWPWLHAYTLWAFAAAMVAWLPYDLGLALKTKNEHDRAKRAAKRAAYYTDFEDGEITTHTNEPN